MNQEQLAQLKRPELQQLAKIHGVRANLKTDAIIAQLLERFPHGVPYAASGDVAEGDSASQAAPQHVEQADAASAAKPKPRRRVAMKPGPGPRARAPKATVKVTDTAAANEASASANAAPAAEQQSPIPPDNVLGLIINPSASTVETSARCTIKIPASKLPPATDAEDATDQGAFTSHRTRARKGPRGGRLAGDASSKKKDPRLEAPDLADVVARVLNGPNPPDPSRVTYDEDKVNAEIDAILNQVDWTKKGGVFVGPSHVPTAHTNVQSPSPPPRSLNFHTWAEGAVPQIPEPLVPRAAEAETEAVVRKMMDISKVHKQRWRLVKEYDRKASALASTVSNLRTLVRQERAHRIRRENYLSYWNPVSPAWKEGEIWNAAYPTRINEEGLEVEIQSDEEDPIQDEYPRPPGAKATDIVMRRRAYRRDPGDEDVRVSEVLELTADRKLAPPKPSNGKRRRCTPMGELEGANQRLAKRARGADGAPADGAISPVPAPNLGAIAEDAEDEAL